MKLEKLTSKELEHIVNELYKNTKSLVNGYEPIVIPQLLKYLLKNKDTQNFNLLQLILNENFANI